MTKEPNDSKKELEAQLPENPIEEEESQSSTSSFEQTSEKDYDDFIFTRYHGKKRNIFSSQESHNTTRSYTYKNNFVKEANARRKDKKPIWKKLLIIFGIVIGALVLLGVIGVLVFFILKENGLSQLRAADVNMTAPLIENAQVSVDSSANTITYQGQTYVYNGNMTSILCMGVDKSDGLGLDNGIVGTGGQADAIYLLAMDTETGKTTVIGVSRDIYSDIGVYTVDGKYSGTEYAQLCLAYAYGDGKETSCENTVNAVERLFYNLPINSYFAMDLNAVPDLNDAIGGVNVTITDEYLYNATGYEWHRGDTVHLDGIEAVWYLQYRNVDELASGVDRMNRQLSYLQQYCKTAVEMTKSDLSTPIRLFGVVQDYAVTNLNASKISALAYTAATSGTQLEFKKVPGEITHNGEYAQYVVDEQGLLELILEVYYKPQ